MSDAPAGPAQTERAEVFAVQHLGEHTQLTVISPRIASTLRPGQFVTVPVGGPSSALMLPQVPCISAVTPGGTYSGTVSFVVSGRDAGSRWLAARNAGDTLDLVGPLGLPCPLPAGPSPAVLLGGGHRAAGLGLLAHALIAGGSPIENVLGAATAGRLYGELSAKRLVGRVTVVTGDGSAGERGSVTDVLPAAIARIGAEVVYAYGPTPMLAAVSAVAQRHAIRAQVSVATPMACGTGVCQGCVLPVRDAGQRTRYVRACVDGPVLEGGRVRWDDLPAPVGAGAAAAGGA